MREHRHLLHGLVHAKVWLALGIFSVVLCVATAVLVPVLLTRMPKDFFVREAPPRQGALAWRVLKNVLGVAIVLLGVAMLVLPGQGLITILLGLGLIDFPGRRRLELAVIGRRGVLKSVNALRRKFGREPLELPRRD